MTLAYPPVLSDEALEQMTREELLQHLRKLQQAVVALSNASFNGSGYGRRKRGQRHRSSIQMLPTPLSEMQLTTQGQQQLQPTRQRHPSEFSDPLHIHRLSSSFPDDVNPINGHCGETTSLLSVLSSGGTPGQVASLPTAVPVTHLLTFPPQNANDTRALSISNASMSALAPARLTDKLNVARNEAGTKYINSYQIIRELGRGSCGKVHLAYDEDNTSLVAIKQVRRVDTTPRVGGQTVAQIQFHAFQREVAVMKKLRHKNIVPLYEVIDDPNAKKVYIVMMYVDRGPIAHVKCDPSGNTDVNVCEPIPKTLLASYARQILSGLGYLHEHKVVHRDIKPGNILVNRNGQVYLSDFGVSEVFDNNIRERLEQMMQESMAASRTFGGNQGGATIQGTKGTMLFIAPELWRGDRSFVKPVDMWALGVTLYILLTGKLPFCTLDDIMDPTLPVIPTSYGTIWTDLLRGMLNRDPKQRLTVSDARLMLKKLGREEKADAPPLCTPINVTEDEVSRALTLAQKQKDEDDVEWLLGQHGGGAERERDEEEEQEEVGIGYGLPCVISPNEKAPPHELTIDRLKHTYKHKGTSPITVGTGAPSPLSSPRQGRSPYFIQTANPLASRIPERSPPHFDSSECSMRFLSSTTKTQLGQTLAPLRSPSSTTINLQSNLSSSQQYEESIPEKTSIDPRSSTSQTLEDSGVLVAAERRKVKGGIFTALWDALLFSRSKKKRIRH